MLYNIKKGQKKESELDLAGKDKTAEIIEWTLALIM